MSALCSAFSGEVIKYTTVKRYQVYLMNIIKFDCRGEISIYDSRVSIYGCIQPDPLAELLEKDADEKQGYFLRYLYLAAVDVSSSKPLITLVCWCLISKLSLTISRLLHIVLFN